MTQQRLAQIERRIDKIKAERDEIGAMQPGSLSKQYKDPGTQSGPCYPQSDTLDMKSRTEYIHCDSVNNIRRQVSRYKRFKTLSAEWVALGIEHARLAMKLARRQSSASGGHQHGQRG